MPRKPSQNMGSRSFSDDDVPNSQSKSLKLAASRRVDDLQRMRQEIVSGHDSKTGLLEQSDPHEDSPTKADDPAPHRPKASKRTESARHAGFQRKQEGGFTWQSRRPEPEAEQKVKTGRPMKVLAWGRQSPKA